MELADLSPFLTFCLGLFLGAWFGVEYTCYTLANESVDPMEFD